ncbi:ABC transporter permease [Dactylosporangium fulvum]|uniref:ABC transporter permease n=1 Tax=Dactylosporangium fulvum TaxID=53359 RepID=A0ABY5VSB1_9ACTN|nr:ABC transporter permease [Dactylosporangium fulvum]UWP80075.1 ABC transporter permease [Dactylosporangium fulvum]
MTILRRPSVAISLTVLGLLALAAILAPVLPLADPLQGDLMRSLEGPSAQHLLGTDTLGRDVLSRMIYATRVSLVVAAGAVLVALLVGAVLGMLAGYFGGKFDSLISFITDAYLAFPPILLAIAVLGALGRGTVNTVGAIAFIFVPRFIRVARGAVVARRGEVYIDAAHVIGASTPWIIRRHVLPNIAAPIIVQAALAAGFAMLAEASLSFLGLGVQAPAASWGSMLGDASQQIYRQPLLMIWPGLAIAVCVFCFNLIGEAMRDAMRA